MRYHSTKLHPTIALSCTLRVVYGDKLDVGVAASAITHSLHLGAQFPRSWLAVTAAVAYHMPPRQVSGSMNMRPSWLLPCHRFASQVTHSLPWRRQMTHVLYEEDHLPQPNPLVHPDLPLPLADTVADHQGLHLSTDGDNLVGRAANGKPVHPHNWSTTLATSWRHPWAVMQVFGNTPVLVPICCHAILLRLLLALMHHTVLTDLIEHKMIVMTTAGLPASAGYLLCVSCLS